MIKNIIILSIDCKMLPTKIYYIVFSEEFVCRGRSKILSPWSNVRHLSTFSVKTFINIKLRSHGNEQNECFPLAYDRWSVVSLSKYKISEPKVTYWTIYTLFNFNCCIYCQYIYEDIFWYFIVNMDHSIQSHTFTLRKM